MPYVPIRLKALRVSPFSQEPSTLGEHIKHYRLQRQLTQKQAAKFLGVGAFTVLNWERNKTVPPIQATPAILKFLGYDPFPQPKSLPEQLLAKRRIMGWSIKEAAREFGVDEGTWSAWESGATVPQGRYRALLDRFLVPYSVFNEILK